MRKTTKKMQRYVNKVVRGMNKDIVEDWLWNGRFSVKQLRSSVYRFPDLSGYSYYVELRFNDNKTGKTKDQAFEMICEKTGSPFKGNFFKADVWRAMNTFITIDVDANSEVPDPWTQAKSEGRSPQ